MTLSIMGEMSIMALPRGAGDVRAADAPGGGWGGGGAEDSFESAAPGSAPAFHVAGRVVRPAAPDVAELLRVSNHTVRPAKTMKRPSIATKITQPWRSWPGNG